MMAFLKCKMRFLTTGADHRLHLVRQRGPEVKTSRTELREEIEAARNRRLPWWWRRHLHKNASLFEFLMFVPSLSWQIFSFECYIKLNGTPPKGRVFLSHPWIEGARCTEICPCSSGVRFILDCALRGNVSRLELLELRAHVTVLEQPHVRVLSLHIIASKTNASVAQSSPSSHFLKKCRVYCYLGKSPGKR